MKVKALRMGFMFSRRIKEGEVFNIPEELFSSKWMIKIEEVPAAEQAVEEKPQRRRTRKPKESKDVL